MTTGSALADGRGRPQFFNYQRASDEVHSDIGAKRDIKPRVAPSESPPPKAKKDNPSRVIYIGC